MGNKLVSVIIPTYKRSDTLPRAINSVLNQSYKKIEIIVVDDNDPDSEYRKQTEHTMKKYSNNLNISYIKHEINKNGSAARNTGFRSSNGDYIMFLDDDDEFTENKIDAQVKKMNCLDESWGACYTNYIRKKNGETIIYGAEKREGHLLTEELMRNLFVHAGSNLMVKRFVVEELNGFDESFQRNQDVEFLSRLLLNYKLAYVDVVGLVVHVHNREFSNMKFEEVTLAYIEKFSNMINELPDNDRIRINKMINLQLFRHYITNTGKRKKAFQHIANEKIPIHLVLKYIFHLFIRKLSKRAYGFKI